MTFKSGANGIAKKGKTKGKNFGNSGPNVGITKEIKGKGGKTNENMKSMGRNMAKIAAQRGK
jgi:hypothetical protein